MQKWNRKVLVVEDDRFTAHLIAEILTNNGFEVETALNSAEAIRNAKEFDPDGTLIDLNLGSGPNGIQVATVIRKNFPHIAILFLTNYPDPSAFASGGLELPTGSGYLRKDLISDSEFLVDSIEKVLIGDKKMPDQRNESPLNKLTPTQLEILRLAALGLTNAAIATRRSTQERTVEQRFQNIYQVMKIPTTAEINPRVEVVRQYIIHAGLPSE